MSDLSASGGFLAPVTARERSPWRLGLFLLLALGFVILALAATLVPLHLAWPNLLLPVTEALETGGFPDGPRRLLDENRLMVVLAVSLAAPALGLLLAAAVVYGRPPASFLWPDRRFSLAQLASGFVVMAALVLVAGVIGTAFGLEVRLPVLDPQYPLDTRVLYAAVAAVLLLVAAAAEEVACRGVLLQITAGFTRRAWLLCLVNGLVFAAIHLDPDPVAFVARGLSGALWAWAALRLGGLEFAIGAHWANNLMIALFGEPISSAGQTGQGFPLESLWYDGGVSLGVLVAVELWVRRRRRASAA